MCLESGELPVELCVIKLSMGFQQCLVHLSPSWVVNKAPSLSQHLAEQGCNTWSKLTTM